MKRFAAAAAALGLLTASCSGMRSAGSLLPASGLQFGGNTPPSSAGARSTRAATAAAAPSGWSNTATQPFSLKSATDLGALNPSQAVTVRVGLQLHNVDALKQAVQSHAKLAPSTILATYGPTAAEVAKVTDYLKSSGLGNIIVEPNNLLISATGDATSVSKAFNTSLHSFSLNGATVFANTTAAYVPEALGGTVVGVLGLNNVQVASIGAHPKGATINHAPPSQSAAAPQPESPCAISSVFIVGLPSPQPIPTPQAYTTGCPRNYTPSDYWRAYDVNVSPAASNVSIAIMTEGNPRPAIDAFRINEQGDGLPQVPVVLKQVGLASPDVNPVAIDEWTLDMTASTGLAGSVKSLYVYATTSLTDSDIALMYNHWVTDNLAQIGNSSFGGCEVYPYLDGAMLIDDEVFLEGAAQGQTMFASTGDTGSFCSVGNPNGVPGGAPLMEHPAVSPYVVAVGGTTLWTQVDGSYQGESAWNAGGGGLSQFEYSPYWQNGVQPASQTPAGLTFRGVPDISMDADLQTGMIIYLADAGWTTIGGTSLASPLMAGVWARVLQSNPNAGFAAPALYGAWTKSNPGTKLLGPPPTVNTGPFHDVLTGNNGAFNATPGYDYTTGLGTVDVDALTAAIGKL
jgi:pseudomonalisin